MIKLNGIEVKAGRFPDGTLLMKVAESDYWVKNQHSFRPVVTWLYDGDGELFALDCLVRHLKDMGISGLELELPYVPNARQDRVKNPEDVFTLKRFAEIINGMGFSSVRVTNPHSSVAMALIDRVREESIEPDLRRVLDDVGADVFFYPDEGACKRYSGLSMGRDTAFGIKSRDWSTGKILGLSVVSEKPVKGRRVLIVDDICSYGGTFYHSAAKLREMGAERVYLYVTHCENSILDGCLIGSGMVDGIYTTNSIFRKSHPLVTVFDRF